MSENKLGNNIVKYRKALGMSQEKVADHLRLSRQAVTKWENGSSKPSSDNLISLAELFHVEVEVLLGNKLEDHKEEKEISVGKLPWLFCVISIVCTLAYTFISNRNGIFEIGTLICLFVISIPIQMFMHIYLSNAIRLNSIEGIAGFDSKIEYNMQEVKKMLVQIDLTIELSSSVCVFLLCAVNVIDVSFAWMSNIIFLMYIGTFIFNILVINYRMADKIYKDEIDIQHAKLGFPFTVGYIIVLFIGIVSTVGLFNIRGIENNTPEAIKTAVLLIIGVIFATVGYFIESSNIKSNVDIERPRIKKVGVVTMVASIIIYIMMWII